MCARAHVLHFKLQRCLICTRHRTYWCFYVTDLIWERKSIKIKNLFFYRSKPLKPILNVTQSNSSLIQHAIHSSFFFFSSLFLRQLNWIRRQNIQLSNWIQSNRIRYAPINVYLILRRFCCSANYFDALSTADFDEPMELLSNNQTRHINLWTFLTCSVLIEMNVWTTVSVWNDSFYSHVQRKFFSRREIEMVEEIWT